MMQKRKSIFYGSDTRIDLQNWMQIDFAPDASAHGQKKT